MGRTEDKTSDFDPQVAADRNKHIPAEVEDQQAPEVQPAI